MAFADSDKDRESKGWVRLKEDGDAVVLLLVVEPESVKQPGMRGGVTTRFRWGVIEGGEVKVLETSGECYDEIAGRIRRRVPAKIKLTRHGKTGDKKTFYVAEDLGLDPEDLVLVKDSAKIKEATDAVLPDVVPF